MNVTNVFTRSEGRGFACGMIWGMVMVSLPFISVNFCTGDGLMGVHNYAILIWFVGCLVWIIAWARDDGLRKIKRFVVWAETKEAKK